MASLTIILWSRPRTDDTHTIAFRLTIDRISKFEMTSHHVTESQFTPGLSDWVRKHPDARLINRNLELRRQEIMARLMDAEAGKLPMTHTAIFTGVLDEGLTVGRLLKSKAEYFEKRGSKRNFRKMLGMKAEALECWGGDLAIAALTEKRVEELDMFLRKGSASEASKGSSSEASAGATFRKPNGPNTIWKKFRTIAQLIDKEKDRGNYTGANWFKLYKITKEPTKKEKLSWDEIEALTALQLPAGTFILHVRDMFLFSFYAHGMRFENCITFERETAREMLPRYRTNKGKKHLEIAIHPKLAEIIEQYAAIEREFLFPFLVKRPSDPWIWDDVKGSINSEVNRELKKIAYKAGIHKVLTFHMARHTFADLLKKHQAAKGRTNIYLIQEALGHSDIRTTQGYLASLGNDEVNKEVNEMFGERG